MLLMYNAAAFHNFHGYFLVRYDIELLVHNTLVGRMCGLVHSFCFTEDNPGQYPEQLDRQKACSIVG